MDIIKPDIPMPRSSRVEVVVQSAISMFVPANRQSIKINLIQVGNNNFAALMGTLQVIQVAMQQSYAFRLIVMATVPEPKTQLEASMGTIVYVPNCELPDSTTLIPTKFAYKCKFDENSNVIKKKVQHQRGIHDKLDQQQGHLYFTARLIQGA
eukprot:3085529-Rhodomonas_salina.3